MTLEPLGSGPPIHGCETPGGENIVKPNLVSVCVISAALLVALARMPAAAAEAAEWGPIDLQSGTVAPGTKEKFTFAMQRSFESGFLDAALWAARGSEPGPTLCVVSGIHGDEINSVEIARRSFHAVDPARLKGTLIVVPAANSLGFRTMNRYMIDRRDLNRAFPGSVKGSVASIVANAIFERVIRRCDNLVDLHTGSNFRTNVPQIRVDMEDPGSLALAENFGVGVIVGGAGPSGSLRREAVRAGVAAIIYEAGPPYAFVEKEIEAGTRGVLNVLDYLGMYETTGEREVSQKLTGSSWVRVPKGKGGIFLTRTKLGDVVKEGDLLGTVTDPVTDVDYEVRANRSGIVIGAALPQVVLSGYGVFHIGQVE
jgi:predicted deacylase